MTLRPFQFSPQSSAQTLLATIRQRVDVEHLDTAVVLGSGWAETLADAERIGRFRYADWPCFPAGQIKGHPGCLDIVRSAGKTLAVFRGRFHCYQGLSAYETSFPVRLASALGCRRLLLCCATGGINPDYLPGDYMLVDDHLNLLGDNPLRGLNDQVFIDLGSLYDVDCHRQLAAVIATAGIRLHRGVLAAMPGPSYETPAEVRMLKSLGADVVSMSVVGEAIMARYLGLRVAALALVANPGAGLATGTITHADVLASGRLSAAASSLLLENLLSLWSA
ncbi:MAG: purine-nucleoside phosphorylase [Desulfuromonadales bacterium]|nr:purine-nucleoside phosphorylase [Desulfuromonadales bacterium]